MQFRTAVNRRTCYFAMFCFPSPPSHSRSLSCKVVLTIGCTQHSSSVFASWTATVLHQGQITWKHYSGYLPTQCLCVLLKARLPYNKTGLHRPTSQHRKHKWTVGLGRTSKLNKHLHSSHSHLTSSVLRVYLHYFNGSSEPVLLSIKTGQPLFIIKGSCHFSIMFHLSFTATYQEGAVWYDIKLVMSLKPTAITWESLCVSFIL